MKNLNEDDIRDIAIRITDKLVKLCYVPDCMDTDNEDEFVVQDLIIEILTDCVCIDTQNQKSK